MANFKVGELSPELRLQLGYVPPPPPKTNTPPAVVVQQTLAKMETPEVKQIKADSLQWVNEQFSRYNLKAPEMTPKLLQIIAAAWFALYLFFCYCCMKICQKAGSQPGILVWLPVFQVIPLLRAAQMSAWWFLVLFSPSISVALVLSNTYGARIAFFASLALVVGLRVVWGFKIAYARGKSPVIGVMLLLPVLDSLAFLYLAFSSASGDSVGTKQRLNKPAMALGTA